MEEPAETPYDSEDDELRERSDEETEEVTESR